MVDRLREEPKNFSIHFGNFLDEYYRTEIGEKAGMLIDEPIFYPEITKETYAYLAAAAEKLSNDAQIEAPPWVFQSKYFLEEPYFPFEAKGYLRVILLMESPNEFLVRNIFVSENVLNRI